MTYNDIIEFIMERWEFEPNEDAREAFNTISDDWKADNRDTLANTLGDEKEAFIGRIQNLISQTDEADPELVERADAIERGIEQLSKSIGAESIITRISNFFRGLFR